MATESPEDVRFLLVHHSAAPHQLPNRAVDPVPQLYHYDHVGTVGLAAVVGQDGGSDGVYGGSAGSVKEEQREEARRELDQGLRRPTGRWATGSAVTM